MYYAAGVKVLCISIGKMKTKIEKKIAFKLFSVFKVTWFC